MASSSDQFGSTSMQIKKKKKELKRHSMYTGPLGNVLIIIVIMAPMD